MTEYIFEDDEMSLLETNFNQLLKAPAKIEDDKVEVQDLLEKVNLGTTEDPKPVYINALLQKDLM